MPVVRLLFIAYVALTAVHVSVVMSREPFAYDAWNVARDTGAVPASAENFVRYGIDQYTHSNPRVGQWFTYLAYKLDGFAEVASPLAFLALACAITVLGLGRFPWRRPRDLALSSIVVGSMWFALPQIGMVLFCRAYGANYVYGAAIQLWFLAVLRLRPEGNGSALACIAYALLGLVAGASNEHTGPTLVVFALAFAAWRYRHSERTPNLALAGALGAVVGFAVIFFAPGQGERYEGLATKVSLAGRLAQRGITANLDILGTFVIAAAPVLLLVAIVLVIGARDAETEDRRRAVQRLGWALAAAALVTVTLFVSPKLGPRFFLAGCALLLAALIGIADTVLTTPRRMVPFVLLALFASGYAAQRTLPLYARLEEASMARLFALEQSKPGTVVTLDALDQIEDSWWFLGDDARFENKRALIATYFGLTDVIFRAVDLDAPLGVSDVRIVPRGSDGSRFALGPVRGLDVGSVQRAGTAAIERMRRQGTVGDIELAVEFLGDRPELPRPTLLLGHWAGVIERDGTSRRRVVVLPQGLRGSAREILIYSVGHDWKSLGTGASEKLMYEPWRRGAYWALACGPAECFVIAATRML